MMMGAGVRVLFATMVLLLFVGSVFGAGEKFRIYITCEPEGWFGQDRSVVLGAVRAYLDNNHHGQSVVLEEKCYSEATDEERRDDALLLSFELGADQEVYFLSSDRTYVAGAGAEELGFRLRPIICQGVVDGVAEAEVEVSDFICSVGDRRTVAIISDTESGFSIIRGLAARFLSSKRTGPVADFAVLSDKVVAGVPAVFQAYQVPDGGISYDWRFSGRQSMEVLTEEGDRVSVTWDVEGDHLASLAVEDGRFRNRVQDYITVYPACREGYRTLMKERKGCQDGYRVWEDIVSTERLINGVCFSERESTERLEDDAVCWQENLCGRETKETEEVPAGGLGFGDRCDDSKGQAKYERIEYGLDERCTDVEVNRVFIWRDDPVCLKRVGGSIFIPEENVLEYLDVDRVQERVEGVQKAVRFQFLKEAIDFSVRAEESVRGMIERGALRVAILDGEEDVGNRVPVSYSRRGANGGGLKVVLDLFRDDGGKVVSAVPEERELRFQLYYRNFEEEEKLEYETDFIVERNGGERFCKVLFGAGNKFRIVFYGAEFGSVDEFERVVERTVHDPGNFLDTEPFKSNYDAFEVRVFPRLIEGGVGPNGVSSPMFEPPGWVCPADIEVRVINRKYRSFVPPGSGFRAISLSAGNPETVFSVFTHELGHAFGGLKDEYVESWKGDRGGAPNCAKSEDEARAWWGDLLAVGDGDFEVGFYKGCSYVSGNIRPTENSIMKDHTLIREDKRDRGFGPVNERAICRALDSVEGVCEEYR